jgi:hypothetical protein
MISLDDCIGLCGLTAEEVAAVAEHEHMPEIAASALARYLLNRDHGLEDIQKMIVDDIRAATAERNFAHAAELVFALKHLLETHPQSPSCHASVQPG